MGHRLIYVVVFAAASAAHAEPWLGLTVDAGVPDGVATAIVVRPTSRLRLHGGITHNAISRGARAGVTLAPLRTWISPTLSLDVGAYPEGDANPLVRRATGDATFHATMLERVGYQYANAHVGIELGRERATFYIHAGVSYLSTNVRGLDGASDDATTMVTFTQDPVIEAWTISARLGFILYIH